MPASSISQEPIPTNIDLLSHLRRLSHDSIFAPPFFHTNSFSSTSHLSKCYFNGFPSPLSSQRRTRKPVFSCGLTFSSSKFHLLWSEYNRFLRFHCGLMPIGFSSSRCLSNESNSVEDDGAHAEEVFPNNAAEVDSPKKVLILMSDTGGGHRASAEAIKAAFNQEFGDEYQVFVTDLWTDHTPWPFNQLPRSYNFLVKHGTLWKMTYYGSSPRLVHQSNFAATSAFIARFKSDFTKITEAIAISKPTREVAKGLMKYQPDIIISVHPLMQHVPLRILRAKGLLDKIVFTTVITDLSTCHPTWFHKLVTRCYCPSTTVAKRALKAGLTPDQIKVYGLPVRPSFVKPIQSKVELRRELGMNEDLPAVLLMGGGEGMGPIEATARALGEMLYDETLGEPIGQLLVICGRNKKLANKLLTSEWKIPVQVKGFVTKMEECMGACDCIITKAGPGTIAEAMIRGLPIILNGFIAGQEAGNVSYVVENGCGKFSKSPRDIAKIVAGWFGSNSAELRSMSQTCMKLARPDAVFKIVRDLHELVKQRNLAPQLSCTS